MPKKKRVRKPARNPRPSHRNRLLVESPARILRRLEEMGADEESKLAMIQWPYRVEDGPPISIKVISDEQGIPPLEVADGLVAMEDANLLLWQPPEQKYWMLQPDPNAAT
jgi:hypothetical protein